MTVAIFRFSPILWLHGIQYGGVEARKYIAFIVVSFAFFDFFFFCFLRSFFCLSLSAFFRAFCCFRHCLNWPFIFVCSCRKLSICLRVVSTNWRLRMSLSELHIRRSLSNFLFSLRIVFLTGFISLQLGRKLRLHCQKNNRWIFRRNTKH